MKIAGKHKRFLFLFAALLSTAACGDGGRSMTYMQAIGVNSATGTDTGTNTQISGATTTGTSVYLSGAKTN